MRSPSTSATAELARQHGSFPARVVAISWDGESTLHYSDDVFDVADGTGETISVAARVAAWPEITWGGDDPTKIAASDDISLTLEDHDGAFLALVAGAYASDSGLFRVRVGLYLFWRSHLGALPLTWPSDRLELFDGVVESVSRSVEKRQVTLKLTSWHKRYSVLLGHRITRDKFPEAPVKQSDSLTIPLVFGDGVRRVPAVLIDRPGYSQLLGTCHWHENSLRIIQDADDAGFPLDEDITLTVGVPGNVERITGRFETADKSLFVISNRDYWHGKGDATAATGAIAVPVGGIDYTWLPAFDSSGRPLMDSDASRAGYLVAIYAGGEWQQTILPFWRNSGRFRECCYAFDGMAANALTPYKWRVCSVAGQSPFWPSGVSVMEVAPHVLAVNSEPSVSVDRVEFRSRPNGNSSTPPLYYTLREDQYDVDLDNRDYMEALGRDPDHETGITTISLSVHPAEFGMESEAFVTLSGVIDPESIVASVDPDDWWPLTTMSGIAKWMLMNPRAANMPDALVDADGIDDAQDVVDLRESSGYMRFALTEPTSVWDALEAIAAQSTCRLRIEGGVVSISPVADYDATSAATCSDANSIRFDSEDTIASERPLRVTARVRRYVGDGWPGEIHGTVNGAAANTKEQDWNWTAFQNVSDANPVHQWWQRWLAEKQRLSTVGRFVDALSITPNDRLAVTIDSASADHVVAEEVRLNATKQVTLTGASRVTAVELDSETAPKGIVVSAWDRTEGGNTEPLPNVGGWLPGRENRRNIRYMPYEAPIPSPSPMPDYETYGVPPSIRLSGGNLSSPIVLNGFELWPSNSGAEVVTNHGTVTNCPYWYGVYESTNLGVYGRSELPDTFEMTSTVPQWSNSSNASGAGYYVTLAWLPYYDTQNDPETTESRYYRNCLSVTVNFNRGISGNIVWQTRHDWTSGLNSGFEQFIPNASGTSFTLRDMSGGPDMTIEFVDEPPRFWWQHGSVYPCGASHLHVVDASNVVQIGGIIRNANFLLDYYVSEIIDPPGEFPYTNIELIKCAATKRWTPNFEGFAERDIGSPSTSTVWGEFGDIGHGQPSESLTSCPTLPRYFTLYEINTATPSGYRIRLS